MQLTLEEIMLSEIGALVILLVLAAALSTQALLARVVPHVPQSQEGPTGGQIRAPSRAAKPAFESKPAKQKTEIHFDPATRTVTIKLRVQDQNGKFIPNIRRENFIVYEDGIRQQDATVDIEHAPVSLGLLMEFGGRTQALNQLLGLEVARTGHQLVEVLGPDDKIAIFLYNDKVKQLADFSQGREALNKIFEDLGTPQFSETNLYDAVLNIVEEIRPVKGRKAVILISSGVDTFSKTKYEDALKAAGNSDSPIYVISLAPFLHDLVEIHQGEGLLAHMDWNALNKQLQQIAQASGGRAYSHQSAINLSAIYDDMMENLRVRYVIRYRPSNVFDLNTPRKVRVEQADHKTGGLRQVVHDKGRPARARVIVQDSYVPSAAAAD